MKVIKEGKVGNIRYQLIENDKLDNNYSVILKNGDVQWTAVDNTGEVACEAFIEGFKVGRCRSIIKACANGYGFSEYGY